MPARPAPPPQLASSSASSPAQPAPVKRQPPLPQTQAVSAPAKQPETPAPARPATPPQHASSAQSSVRITHAQPHVQWCEAPKIVAPVDIASSTYSYTYSSDEEATNSAAQPADEQGPAPKPADLTDDESDSSAAQPAVQAPLARKHPLPRVYAIFGSDDTADLQDVLEKLSKEYLFGKVGHIVSTSTGCYEAASALPVIEKLETFLEIIQEQRAHHLQRHPEVAADAVFTDADMQEIHKTWMDDYKNWMQPVTVAEYEWYRDKGTYKRDKQHAHQLRRKVFSACLFQVIGNKHVLLAAIQHPMCSAAQHATSTGSAAQPATILQKFMAAWEPEKNSED